MSCCKNPDFIGCVAQCEPLNLGVAPVGGIYTFDVEFSGQIIKQKRLFDAGDPIVFSNLYNEAQVHVGRLISPAGVEVGCFSFQNKITKNI